MVEVIINDNVTKIIIGEIEIIVNGDFEIKKKKPACTGSKD